MSKVIIDDLIQNILTKHYANIEQGIELAIRPKPRWLPTGTWLWLLKNLLVLEVFAPFKLEAKLRGGK